MSEISQKVKKERKRAGDGDVNFWFVLFDDLYSFSLSVLKLYSDAKIYLSNKSFLMNIFYIFAMLFSFLQVISAAGGYFLK